jgi:phosphate starvation-inducible PhoH-like protein
MFLTRLGLGSNAVLTGDVTQIDLPSGKESGLLAVERILRGIDGIAFCKLSNCDVVRHDIVQKIVKAYETYEAGFNGNFGHSGQDSQALVS